MPPELYLILKALHLIAVIAWMAGMLYLPRLFVYHAQTQAGSDTSELFKRMEYRLLRYIMNPAMMVTLILGIILMVMGGYGTADKGVWIHVKILLVLMLCGVHGLFSFHRKQFYRDENKKDHAYFRKINELPTILMILIVFLVVLKPF